MTIDLDQAGRAIQATREGLQAAGYGIDVAQRDGRLVFSVQAQDGACEECLVPKPIFMDILGRELADAGIEAGDFEVAYPLDGDGA